MILLPHQPRAPANRSARLAGITVEQYHQMIESGILQEGAPMELLNGLLVLKDRSEGGSDPMTVGAAHAFVVGALGDALARVTANQCSVRLQQPITLPPDGEPEPDGAIVSEPADAYRTRHPAPADVHCVVEVAHSSLEHDRTLKQQIYARANLPQYIIINLVHRVVEVYEAPSPAEARYTQLTTLTPGQTVAFSCGGGNGVDVPVERLLP